jgi:hypothetical protein
MSKRVGTHVLTIASLERRNLDAGGNPRFNVYFTDGTHEQTATGSQVNYAIENAEFRNVALDVTFDDDGKIKRVKVHKEDSK